MWRGMSIKNPALVAIMAGFLALAGCDDDDDDDKKDAGPRDAMVPMDAGRDAAAGDADVGDADVGDADVGDAEVDAGADAATDVTFTLMLTPSSEVPPCDAAPEEAEGSATVTLDAANTEIQVMNLTYEGLSGPVTAGHIHIGDTDEAGPIVLDLGPDFTAPINRTFTEEDYPSPAPEGVPDTWDEFIQAMRAGQTYINLHTEACPEGEIRAQID